MNDQPNADITGSREQGAERRAEGGGWPGHAGSCHPKARGWLECSLLAVRFSDAKDKVQLGLEQISSPSRLAVVLNRQPSSTTRSRLVANQR